MQRYRPTGVILIAIWFFFNGLIMLIATFVPLFVRDALAGLGLPGDSMLFLAGILLLLTAVYIALGWGLLELRNWARIATIGLAGIGLIGTIIGAVQLLGGSRPIIGSVPILWAVIYGLVIWYLTRVEVQDAFASLPGWNQQFGGEVIQRTIRDQDKIPDYERSPEAMGGGTVRSDREASLPRTRVLDEAPPVSAWLVVQRGREQGRQFGLTTSGYNFIGRDSARCDIMLDDTTISGQHAQIRWENGRFVVYDMGSLNHTKVNGRLVQRQSLLDNDVLQLGETTMVFKSVTPHQR